MSEVPLYRSVDAGQQRGAGVGFGCEALGCWGVGFNLMVNLMGQGPVKARGVRAWMHGSVARGGEVGYHILLRSSTDENLPVILI